MQIRLGVDKKKNQKTDGKWYLQTDIGETKKGNGRSMTKTRKQSKIYFHIVGSKTKEKLKKEKKRKELFNHVSGI